ncbi:MAG TPA: preprotein translocase subunit SecG [Acidobacteriaceae bacterium]|jgi:preprotein translocase subunit SecG|nr:preprotein translocase subunit SecG [Acidobacteriaceae bacterium]
MIAFLTVIHVLVCFVLIGIILLQPGKGADLAGAFGGQGSQTAFGPRGTANLLTKATTWAAILFAITSVSLTVLIARRGNGTSVLHGMQSAPTHSAPAPRK